MKSAESEWSIYVISQLVEPMKLASLAHAKVNTFVCCSDIYENLWVKEIPFFKFFLNTSVSDGIYLVYITSWGKFN